MFLLAHNCVMSTYGPGQTCPYEIYKNALGDLRIINCLRINHSSLVSVNNTQYYTLLIISFVSLESTCIALYFVATVLLRYPNLVLL